MTNKEYTCPLILADPSLGLCAPNDRIHIEGCPEPGHCSCGADLVEDAEGGIRRMQERARRMVDHLSNDHGMTREEIIAALRRE